MSHTTFTFQQNRRRQTPITTISSLQIRTTHNTLVQLHQHKHTTKGHGFVDGSRGGGHLLVEWRGHQSTSRPGYRIDGEIHRPVCVEREVSATTAYTRWNCQVIQTFKLFQLILPNRFLDGFPDPSQCAAAKLTHHYSSKPRRHSDSSRSWLRILLSGDVHPNPGTTTTYPVWCVLAMAQVTGGIFMQSLFWMGPFKGLQNAAEYRRIKDWVFSCCNPPPTLLKPQALPTSIPTQAIDGNSFTIMQFNVNGIDNRLTELCEFLERHNVTVIQESKLSSNSQTPSIQNFTTVRKDRHQGQGSGHINSQVDKLHPVPTTPACTWWNRPEEDLSSGKLESTHPSRAVVKSIEAFLLSPVSCTRQGLITQLSR